MKSFNFWILKTWRYIMSKINGNLLFPDPVQENDAVNLKYLNEGIDVL